jgi:methyl-accepting chemotaxis protein WspA
MFGFSTKSIRFKLYSLVPATLLAVGIALGLGLYVQWKYAVGGPVVETISAHKDLYSDTTPAVLILTKPVITLQEMEAETNPAEIARLIEQFHAEEARYRETRDRWLRDLPPGDLRTRIERDLHQPAEELFRIANREYIPVVQGKDKGNRAEPLRRILARFAEQRRVGDQVSKQIGDLVKAEQQDAIRDIRFWSGLNLIVTIVAVLLLVMLKWLVARSIVRSTDVLNTRMQQLASGASDLTARVEVDSEDELGLLAQSINALIAKIQSIVGKVREASLQLLSVASQIAATARQQEQTVQNLSASTTEVAASVREISATSKDLSGTMNEVNQSAGHAAELATRGRDNTTRMATEMKHLVESTASVSAKLGMIREKADSINAVVTTITKVADQTNLLSINAAIEAEKAGEYGRGFLVVAREIRRLADQTAVATLDIETMVRQMQDAVSAGVMQMDKFADEVRSGVGQVTTINQMTYEIITEVQNLSDRFKLVNEGMRNQSVGAEQINEAMGQIADGARRSAQSVQEFERATTHLRGSVEGLNQEISQFKI